MHGKIVHAPLNSNPRVILDIGCGPGDVCRELASAFPGAQIYGIDLSVMPQHADPPPNLKFIHSDIRQLLRGETTVKATDEPLLPK